MTTTSIMAPPPAQAKGLSKLGLTKAKPSHLPLLSLFADFDMITHPATLATFSESETDSAERKASAGSASRSDAAPPPGAGRSERALGRRSGSLSMDFEPQQRHAGGSIGEHPSVRWHTSAPTDSNYTTRPHRPLASKLPPRSPQKQQ